MLHKNIQKELIAWKDNPGRKPPILRGARQVGKTTIAEMLGGQAEKYLNWITSDGNPGQQAEARWSGR